MSSEGGQGSVTIWIGDLKRGGDAAAQHLWGRYFEQLVRETRKKLGTAPLAVADEEDAALSAFKSFFEGVRRDRFPRLDDRDDLWRILIVIAQRKAFDLIRYNGAKRRGAKKVVGQATLDRDQDGRGLDQFEDARRIRGGEAVGAEPSPEMAVIVLEETRRYLDALRDPRDSTLRRVAEMHLQGFTDGEIAVDIGKTRETVARKLRLIRGEWRHLEEEIVVEETQRYLDALHDPTLRRVAEMYLRGSAINEIAKDKRCTGEQEGRGLEAIVVEETRRYLDALHDPTLRRVAEMHLQGLTGDEIAADIGLARESVAHKLRLIRGEWRYLIVQLKLDLTREEWSRQRVTNRRFPGMNQSGSDGTGPG